MSRSPPTKQRECRRLYKGPLGLHAHGMCIEKQKEILEFWFNEIEREDWYRKSDAFDTMMRTRFLNKVELGLEGRLDHWALRDDGRLALILLLDQMTRNLFRDTPRAFAGDEMALRLSQSAAKNGQLDRQADVFRRVFLLMPFMHSEDLSVQKQAVKLFSKYGDGTTSDFARRHFDVIEKYGRFPHRNAILGRVSNAAEQEYLARPDAGF